MIIARGKRKNNIAEYVLYMWEIEDLIRANGFDLDKIDRNIIRRFVQPQQIKNEIRSWYEGLINMMIREGLREKGHLRLIMEIINEMNDLHSRLLNASEQTQYNQKYRLARPHIEEFKKKLKQLIDNDIEVCFNGLYFLLLMRLEGIEVNPATQTAFATFSQLLAGLAVIYKKVEEEKMEI
ncbi:MAG: DUF4924 family protein [Bacteroidetes bacterium]|nr:DUF4924 family protein [Bacteroidota bacterium]